LRRSAFFFWLHPTLFTVFAQEQKKKPAAMIRRQMKECLEFVHAVSGAGFNIGSDIGEVFCWML
jgi:NTP pyrophosphatase (non-canonical NTP hydrolase)